MHELGHLLARRGLYYTPKHPLEEEVSVILYTYLVIADGDIDEAEKVAREQFRNLRPGWLYHYRDHVTPKTHADWQTARQKAQELFDNDLSRKLVSLLIT